MTKNCHCLVENMTKLVSNILLISENVFLHQMVDFKFSPPASSSVEGNSQSGWSSCLPPPGDDYDYNDYNDYNDEACRSPP